MLPLLVSSEVPTYAASDAADAIDFRQIVERSDNGICITQDGHIRYANPKLAEMHGWAADDLLGLHYSELVAPSERAQVAAIRQQRETGLQRPAFVSRNLRRNGSTFDTRIYGRTISYLGRAASLTIISDISTLADTHRQAAWRARMLLNTELLCRGGSIEAGLAHGRVRPSAGALSMVQLSTDTGLLPLAAVLRCLPAEDRALVLSHWRRAVPGQAFEFHHRVRRADGLLLRVLHRGLIVMEDGVLGVDGLAPRPSRRPVAILQDVSQQAADRAQIDRLESCHPVTGLATRSLLLRRASAAVDLARREQRAVAMLYLRVSDFDRIHDALGLHAGDALATELAQRLRLHCRDEDTVAHLEPGEFAVLMDPQRGSDEAQALHTANRLLAELSAPVMLQGTELRALTRVGISLYPGEASNAEQLLEHARAACGRSDGDGGSVAFFTRATGELATRRLHLESALRQALERNELRLHYQPQVDLRNGTVVGVEALLRWTNDAFGAVSPDEFIPIAEEAGLIIAIGEWVFRKACLQSVAWAQTGLPALRIAVNLSPRQLDQADIAQRLQTILLETGANPEHLGIEVTESVLMRDLPHARRALNELSAIGIELALDDFGTGYSNLAVLRELPFDILKIDRSLVHDVTAAPEDVSITRAVLLLARGLKIKVLAEGVETEGQLNLLISNGCEFMQGYVFSKPLPADEVEVLLREGRRLPEQFLARQQRRRTLLLVDDEENVLSSLRRLLRSAGYHIVLARSGSEGMARLAEHDVDVIISDQRMPGMTGVEFLRQAKALYPDTVRIVLSGYTELQSITDAINEGAIYKFLTKPWDDDLLRAHVAEAFQRKELSDENQRLTRDVRKANLELERANEQQQAMLLQQKQQLSLEESRAVHAQDLLENLPTPVVGIDAEGTLVFVNRQARRLTADAPLALGWSAEDSLPADWLAVWRSADGASRRIRIGQQQHLLSCAAMRGRGHLLSIIPYPQTTTDTEHAP